MNQIKKCMIDIYKANSDDEAIEIAYFADSLVGKKEKFNFRSSYRIRKIVESILESSKETSWLTISY